TCNASITTSGSASAASSQRRRLISAIARNSDNDTVPAKESASLSTSCTLANASALRSTAATNSAHTNVGSVNVGLAAHAASVVPAATLAATSPMTTINRMGVNGPSASAASCA